jgi:tight adherence protein C
VPFKSLVAALVQTERFGTSLLDTLRVLSDDIRTSRLMLAETRAARIPVLITIPLIFCMMPAFVMIILGPPIVKVIEQGGIFGDRGPPSSPPPQ